MRECRATLPHRRNFRQREGGGSDRNNNIIVGTLTLIRSVLYRLVHFFLKLFLNTDALSKKNLKKIAMGHKFSCDSF